MIKKILVSSILLGYSLVGNTAYFGCQKTETCSPVTTSTTTGDVTTETTINTCNTSYICYDDTDNSTKSNSCTVPELVGAKLVNTECTQWAGVTAKGCINWKEFNVFPDQRKQVGDCQATPAMIKGNNPVTACINKGNGNAASCDYTSWYGRTKDTQECMESTVERASTGEILYNENGDPVTTDSPLTYKEKPGCGYCVKDQSEDLCYAEPSADNPADSCDIPSACSTQTSSMCTSNEGGICLEQTDTYSCTKEDTSCTKYKEVESCGEGTSTDITYGTSSAGKTSYSQDQNFGQAVEGLAVLKALDANKEALLSSNPIVPKVFGGEVQKCRKPTGFLSSFKMDCCRLNLKRPVAGGKWGECKDESPYNEMKLAASRRSGRTVEVGNGYCSKKKRFGPFKVCVQKTHSFCVFNGKLPKLVAIQGRGQLNKLASTLTDQLQSKNIQFTYYATAPSSDTEAPAAWSTSATVKLFETNNFKKLTIVPWQWGSWCSDATLAAKHMEAHPEDVECASALEQWFAVCEGGDCGNLPVSPYAGYQDNESGAHRWIIQSLDPVSTESVTIGKYTMLQGACDPASTTCSYKVSGFPAGQGGKAFISKDISWLLYSGSDLADAYTENDMAQIGDYYLIPISKPGDGKSLVASTILKYGIGHPSNGSNQVSIDWHTVELPSNMNGDSQTLPGTSVAIVGKCSADSLVCTYKVSTEVEINPKGWGSAEYPDCSGFTSKELTALDFSKMDFSEWISEIMDSIKAKSTSVANKQELENQVKESAQTFFNAMNGEGVKTTGAYSEKVVKIWPVEERTPFNATLLVPRYWPDSSHENDQALDMSDPISKVEVDWEGDGVFDIVTGSATMHSTDADGVEHTGSAYKATHTYNHSRAEQGQEVDIAVKVNVWHQPAGSVAPKKEVITVKVRKVWDKYKEEFFGSNPTLGSPATGEGTGGKTTSTKSIPSPIPVDPTNDTNAPIDTKSAPNLSEP